MWHRPKSKRLKRRKLHEQNQYRLNQRRHVNPQVLCRRRQRQKWNENLRKCRIWPRKRRSYTAFVKRHTMIRSTILIIFAIETDVQPNWFHYDVLFSSNVSIDFMLVVICATIGFMANVLTSRKKSQKIYRNLFAVNASMHVTHRSCSVCVVNRMTKHSSISAAINAKTGFMAAVWAYCNVKPKALTNTFVPIVKRIVRSILQIWKTWAARSTTS